MAKKKPAPKKKRPPRKKAPKVDLDRLDKLGALIDVALESPEADGIVEVKSPSGWAKMKKAGRKGVMLSLSAEQYQWFSDAARADARKLAPWVVLQCLKAIQKA